MIEEESYSALYLYNALIEYIYFLIILIEDKGPNDLDNIAKHVRFFKNDVYTFMQIFNGKNLTEKVGQTLCSTTSVFEIKDNLLHLTNNYTYFKQTIYEDLLVSKVVDLILRGVCKVQDICHNLNFNNLIAIKKDILIAMLEYYPYFHFDSESSVILLQFHGLVGFEKHIYHTTVKYFQSYLQNINVITYKDIKLHSSCIPSCAARNSLVIFCMLHISPYFKCKNGKISLRSRLKRKRHCEQVIDIEKIESKMSSDSFAIGLLVYKAIGPRLTSWTGEVSSLSSGSGLIQTVVSFTNGYQGIFLIYFYKTALKYACEVGDLRHFLNICDVLEFDAEFCGEATEDEVLWQATRIKVTKRVLKGNKYELNRNTEEYMENVDLNYHKLKLLSKICSVKNCLVEYTVFGKESTNVNKLELDSSFFAVNNISKQLEGSVAYQAQDSVLINSNLACNHLVISNCDNNTITQIKPFNHITDNNLDDSLKFDLKKLPKKYTEENVLPNVVDDPYTITTSHEVKKENEFLISHRKKSSEENELPNIVTVANETVTLLEVKNKNEDSFTQTKFLKKFSEENVSLNAVTVPIEEKNKYSILHPKLQKEFSEENATKETTISHDVKNEADCSIIHPKLPKEFSEQNELLNIVAVSKEKILPQKVDDEAECRIIHPKTPKNSSEKNEFINLVAVPNETAIPHEVKNKNKNSIILPNLIPNIFNTSTFLLGEVSFISTCDGVAQSSSKNKPCEIFFKKEDICFQNARNVLMKGNRVLLFIPYVDLDESVLIATLVYPLTSEEALETQKDNLSVQDFIINYFSQRVRKSLYNSWVCNCDISKSLLVGTQLMPNIKNHAATSLKYFKFIQKLHELYQLSDKTCRSLCYLVNQMCAQNIGETYRKLLAHSPFSLAKSLSWIRHSKDHTLYTFKKKFVNRHKFPVKKHRHPSVVDAHKEDCDNTGSIFFKENNIPTILLKSSSFEETCSVDEPCSAHKEDCDNTGSIFFKENNIPTIVLKSSSFEEPCSVDDNCNIINLNDLNNKLLTNNLVSKQSCHESCSSVSSFSSCLDDSAKELSDDVFYSCESDFDSSQTASEQPHSLNKHLFENDRNLSIAKNKINDKSCTFTNECSAGLINLEQIGLKEKRRQKYVNASSYLKLRHFSLFKHRRNKRKVIFSSKRNFCKICYKPPIETTAEITIINKSHIYFKIERKQQIVTLAFPKCLIPVEMQEKIKLNSVIKITIALHPLIHLSQVLYVDFQ